MQIKQNKIFTLTKIENIRNRFKLITFFLVFSFLSVSGAEIFHHHDTRIDENQCPVCIIIHSLSNIDVNSVSNILHPAFFEFIFPVSDVTLHQSNSYTVLSDRAPPLNS